MLIPDQHGGQPCPHLTEKLSCNEDPCEAVKNVATTISKVSATGALLLILTTIQLATHEL